MNIQTLRQSLIRAVFRIMLIGGGLGVVAASYLAVVQQDLELIPLYLVILAAMALPVLWRRMPYSAQVGILVALMYLNALLNLVTEGRGSLGRLFLLVAAFCAVLFWGRRALVPALAGVVLTMAGFAWAFTTQRMTGYYAEVDSTLVAGWISNTVILTVIIFFVTFSINYIFSQLTTALTQSAELTAALQQQQAALQEQVAARNVELVRRTSYLGAAMAVAQEAQAAGGDLTRLLPRVVNIISAQFGFYHTGLFLLDANKAWAVLQAASSAGGQRMLARQHRLGVGSQSIVGYVAARGARRIALDVGQDAVFFDNPDLPNTRSEMAVPLLVHGEILGVLDVQSVEPQAFTDEDVTVLQALADQIAVAVSNAQLLRQLEATLEAERRAMGELSREAWLRLLQARQDLGFYADGKTIVPAGDVWRPEMDLALRKGQEALSADGAALALPLRVREQVIGVIDGYKADGTTWSAEEKSVLQALTEQLNVALEGAQLYADSQRRAARERTVGEVTGRIRETLDIETMLRTAVEEIRAALGLDRLVVRLGAPDETTP